MFENKTFHYLIGYFIDLAIPASPACKRKTGKFNVPPIYSFGTLAVTAALSQVTSSVL